MEFRHQTPYRPPGGYPRLPGHHGESRPAPFNPARMPYNEQQRRPTPYDRPMLPPPAAAHTAIRDEHTRPPYQHDSNAILIDSYSSDLQLDIDASGLVGCPRHTDGFEYMWGGCRATHGVYTGRVCFECHVLEALPVNMPSTETTPHVLRVGWSVEEASMQLGEDRFSYGYGGTGKVSTDSKFVSYGKPFTAGDVITCYADLDSNSKAIFYAVNGVYQGIAFPLEPAVFGKPLFPHVTVKNMRFRLNFVTFPVKFALTPGFTMLGDMMRYGQMTRADPGPLTRSEAQVLMLVGLPAAGKTHWVEQFQRAHPEKKYCVLGTNGIIDKMRIMGLSRKRNYHGRWDVLIKQATAILNKLLQVAETKVRNYIIDQTNVFASARQRKMRPFHGYRRIAIVVVNDNVVLHERARRREVEEGKAVPEAAVMDMKQNFSLPVVGEPFDEVRYVDCQETRSRELVLEFNIEGRRYKGSGTAGRVAPTAGRVAPTAGRLAPGHGAIPKLGTSGNIHSNTMHQLRPQSQDGYARPPYYPNNQPPRALLARQPDVRPPRQLTAALEFRPRQMVSNQPPRALLTRQPEVRPPRQMASKQPPRALLKRQSEVRPRQMTATPEFHPPRGMAAPGPSLARPMLSQLHQSSMSARYRAQGPRFPEKRDVVRPPAQHQPYNNAGPPSHHRKPPYQAPFAPRSQQARPMRHQSHSYPHPAGFMLQERFAPRGRF